MPPEPSLPSTRASFFAMCLAPIAPSAPTRLCCSRPSFTIASGSPVSMAVWKTRPQYRPGRVQYFSSVVRPSPASCCHVTSDFMRMAK